MFKKTFKSFVVMFKKTFKGLGTFKKTFKSFQTFKKTFKHCEGSGRRGRTAPPGFCLQTQNAFLRGNYGIFFLLVLPALILFHPGHFGVTSGHCFSSWVVFLSQPIDFALQ